MSLIGFEYRTTSTWELYLPGVFDAVPPRCFRSTTKPHLSQWHLRCLSMPRTCNGHLETHSCRLKYDEQPVRGSASKFMYRDYSEAHSCLSGYPIPILLLYFAS
ncbi:hypothetical protein FRC03_007116 [Tulasnella sp. 419]|nr:hypothetical protein FRC03_007116 [Tulasnella sp. 419]